MLRCLAPLHPIAVLASVCSTMFVVGFAVTSSAVSHYALEEGSCMRCAHRDHRVGFSASTSRAAGGARRSVVGIGCLRVLSATVVAGGVSAQVSKRAGLDATFGAHGVVKMMDLTNPAIGVQPDGAVITGSAVRGAMQVRVVRLLTDGSRDPAFGTNGETVVPMPEFVGVTEIASLPGG